MGAPCAAVPSPGGSHLPSRPISISQAAMSAGLTGLPRLGLGRLAAKAGAIAKAQSRSGMRALSIGMFHHAMLIDRPACDRVEVMIAERPNGRHGIQLAARRHELSPCRLISTLIIPGATLQNCRTTGPPPGHAKTAEGLAHDRPLKGVLAPTL